MRDGARCLLHNHRMPHERCWHLRENAVADDPHFQYEVFTAGGLDSHRDSSSRSIEAGEQLCGDFSCIHSNVVICDECHLQPIKDGSYWQDKAPLAARRTIVIRTGNHYAHCMPIALGIHMRDQAA